MSESTSETDTPPDRDPILMALLRIMAADRKEGPTGSFGLTVQCGGLTVSGLAVSPRTWLDALSTSLEQNNGEAIGAALREHIDPTFAANAEDEDFPGPFYVYMLDAKIGTNPSECVTVPHWRGALHSVTGWSIGNF